MAEIVRRALVRLASFLLSNIMAVDTSLTLGFDLSAESEHSLATGYRARTELYGELARAAGYFAQRGDAEWRMLVARIQTADNTATELRLDGSSERITVPQLTTWSFVANVTGRRTDATNEGAGYVIVGAIHRDAAASTTRIISSSTLLTAEDNAGWDCRVSADTTNGALVVEVTGENSKNINWVASVWLTQVRTTTV